MKVSIFNFKFYLKHYLIFIVALLSVIVLFNSDSFTQPVISAELDLPKIPSRPSFNQLSRRLNTLASIPEEKIYLNTLSRNSLKRNVEIKGFNNGSSSYNKSTKYSRLLKHSSNHDEFIEKAFGLSSVQLFANLLSTIESLNLSLKFFDASEGNIIVKDRLKNLIVLHIHPQNLKNSNFSKVEIFGYGSIIGKHYLSNTTANILDKLSENIKK